MALKDLIVKPDDILIRPVEPPLHRAYAVIHGQKIPNMGAELPIFWRKRDAKQFADAMRVPGKVLTVEIRLT